MFKRLPSLLNVWCWPASPTDFATAQCALISVLIRNLITLEERVHLTPFKPRPLGGSDDDFMEPNPPLGVHIPQDMNIHRHDDYKSRADYSAQGVHQHINPQGFHRIPIQQWARGYTRTPPFPRRCRNKAGLDGCGCPVAVLCRTGPDDIEWLKRKGGGNSLFCVMEPTRKPAILHTDQEARGTRRYL